jgi:hypothetical protein
MSVCVVLRFGVRSCSLFQVYDVVEIKIYRMGSNNVILQVTPKFQNDKVTLYKTHPAALACILSKSLLDFCMQCASPEYRTMKQLLQ